MRRKDPALMERINDYIGNYYRKEHESPSLREIAEGVGIAKTTAHNYLVEMNEKEMLIYDGRSIINKAVAVTSTHAAKTFGLWPRKGAIQPGSDADFAIVDLDKEYVFHQEDMKSRAKWTPYDGMHFRGKVEKTILRGITTMQDGEITDVRPGKYLPVK